MTTIAYANGLLAADSAAYRGTQYLGSVRKIAKGDDGRLVARSGGASDGFVRWALTASVDDEPFKIGEGNVGLIIRPGAERIEVYEDDGRHFVMAERYAIGCGADFALGAMAMGASPFEAVAVACDLDAYTREPIVTLWIGAATE